MGLWIAGGSSNINHVGWQVPSLTAQESGHPSAVMEHDMNGLHAVSRKVEDQVEWIHDASRVVNLLWKDGHARWTSR